MSDINRDKTVAAAILDVVRRFHDGELVATFRPMSRPLKDGVVAFELTEKAWRELAQRGTS